MTRTLKRVAVAVAATAGLALGLPATQAFAINSVDCGNRNDFLKISVTTSGRSNEFCFANAGTFELSFPDTYMIETGNNAITARFSDGSVLNGAKWSTYNFTPKKRLRSFTIL